MRNLVALTILVTLIAVLGASRASAAGAIAVGIAPGGVARGFSAGFTVNARDIGAAKADALAQCKKVRDNVSGTPDDSGSRAARAQCEVLTTFVNKCYASALDPKDATPGAGWAVADTQEDAEQQALANCRATAGTARRDFCKVFNRGCDGEQK